MLNFSRRIGAFRKDRGGNIVISAALAFPVLLGVGGLVLEYGGGLLDDTRNQRVADLASYAGALAYAETRSEARMRAAAVNVAVLNGIVAEDVVATLQTSPRDTVSVTIHTDRELFLTKLISSRERLDVRAAAMAEVGGGQGTPGCVLALSPTQSGVTLSGGTKIEANDCTVSSNNTVTAPCGTHIWAIGVNYNSTNAPVPCNKSIAGPGGDGEAIIAKQATPDPLLGHAGIAAAFKRFDNFSTVANIGAPAAPATVTGKDIEFGWSTPTAAQATALGCTSSFNSSNNKYTFACPNKAEVNINRMTIGGGIDVDFAVDGNANTTYNFKELVKTSKTTKFGSGKFNFANGLETNGTTTFGSGTFSFGKLITTNGTTAFGDGTYNFSKGLVTGGGAKTTFGAGNFRFGQTENSCNGARYSLCTGGGTTLSFGGPSTFELASGFNNSGGSSINFGAGTTNSFKIGPSSNGNAIDLGGGSSAIMADATGISSVFQVKGHINSGSGGGSCLVISAAADHDIEGNFTAAGAVQFGAGVYTVNGYVSFGQGGGAHACNGESFTVRGADVSFIISGKNVPTAWPCNGVVFCIGAGYSNVQLTAPQTGALARLAVAGPQLTTRTGGATFSEGGSGAKISGAFYFPNGPIEMSGGAGASGGGGPDNCLQFIGSRITLTGGTSATSECIAAVGSEGGGSDRVTLVR